MEKAVSERYHELNPPRPSAVTDAMFRSLDWNWFKITQPKLS
jgi:hypothetical protein